MSRLRRGGQTPLRVRDLLVRQSVLLQADISTPADVLGILVELQEKRGAITNGMAYYNAVTGREATGGTAIGEGIALPHACNAGVAEPGIAALTLRRPLDWAAPDGRPVDLVFLLALPAQARGEQIQLLARLVNLLSNRELTAQLRRATSRGDFLAAIARSEEEWFA